MSRINVVRFVNLKYDHNTIIISDETFRMNGQNTLLSLHNGGGKSVMVQMLMAPFCHKGKRKMKDRRFEDYFRGSSPSFIMVEWALDYDAGYVLTGMMVRENQNVSDDNENELEMYNFISEYREQSVCDIDHIDIVRKGDKGEILRSFSDCRKTFEELKKDRKYKFNYYDMNISAQSKQYFDRLAEYDIISREWETIIHKINEEEAGLANLFADCKDEKGLVSKWFLDAVEKKISGEDKIQGFQDIFEKYILLYNHNLDKMRIRDVISAFLTDSQEMLTAANEFSDVSNQLFQNEALIADFSALITEAAAETEKKIEETEEKIRLINEETLELYRKKFSFAIYTVEEKRSKNAEEMAMLRAEADSLENEVLAAKREMDKQNLAKQKGYTDDAEGAVAETSAKLMALRLKASESEPRRIMLGGKLKAYYSSKTEDLRSRYEKRIAEDEGLKSRINDLRDSVSTLSKDKEKLRDRISRYEAEIGEYDRYEDDFNEDNNTELKRNVVGEYEPGSLVILSRQYEDEALRADRDLLNKRKYKEDIETKKREAGEHREALKIRNAELDSRLSVYKDRLQGYDSELEKRRGYIKYIGLAEKDIFNTELISSGFDEKLSEIETRRRIFEGELEERKKEYIRLKEGKVLELPDNFIKLLGDEDINFVYGMDWLNKSDLTEEEKIDMVCRHPLLPYSLIILKSDIEKLNTAKDRVYTSMPVPIIMREDLAKESDIQTKPVIETDDLRLYVWFNKNLLDEKKLADILAKAEKEIEKQTEAVGRARSEYADFSRIKAELENHNVTEEKYNLCKENIKKTEEEIDKGKKQIDENAELIGNLSEEIKNILEEIDALEETAAHAHELVKNFERLKVRYESYVHTREKKAKEDRKYSEIIKRMDVLGSEAGQLSDKLASGENEAYRLHESLDGSRKELNKYISFRKVDITDTDDVTGLTADYYALTSAVTAQESELTERLAAERQKADREKAEFNRLLKRYDLLEADIDGITFDPEEEAHQSKIADSRQKELDQKKYQLNDCEKKEMQLQGEKRNLVDMLRDKCGSDVSLCEKEELSDTDYDRQINIKNDDLKTVIKEQTENRKRLENYNSVSVSLFEFSELKRLDEVHFNKDIRELNFEELKEERGGLVKKHNYLISAVSKRREETKDIIKKLSLKNEYSEKTFVNSFETILSTADDAEDVKRQISIVTEAYKGQIEKLSADLAGVEKEKQELVDIMLQYVNEVHENIGLIDSNSTINIHGRHLRMLRIETEQWNDLNRSEYENRLQHMIDDITKAALDVLAQNRTLKEFLGARVTTRTLYDAVAGISNVHIHLYKMERDSEIPITWDEVRKNSGGEGFVSSFVIISALMYYMRRNDSVLFSATGGSKVLVMDNPFATTYSEHLLKPVFEVAKKSGVQLICFSGMEEEAIYNSFNNIYVINLISSNLRPGMQYLKANHARGSEERSMISARLQVDQEQNEQMTLF